MEKRSGVDYLPNVPMPDGHALHLSGSDYLCLLGEPSLINAQAKMLHAPPSGRLTSAMHAHGDNPQRTLEQRMAHWMGADDAIITRSGWAANIGLMQAIARPGVPVYLDTLAHTSLWEGALAARASVFPFLHNDARHLQRLIQKHGPGVIAVDSICGTNGSVCPIGDMVAVAEQSGSMLAIDESHSLGTHGPRGSGLVSELGLSERVPFRTASLARAFAGRAGLIGCSSRFKDCLMSAPRPPVLSFQLLQHELAWLNAAIDFISEADERRLRLRALSSTLRQSLLDLGYNVSGCTEQIIALESGPESQTMVLRDALQEHGVFGTVFCAPATPKNRSLIRLTMNSGLSVGQIAHAIYVCDHIREQVDLGSWPSTRRLARKPAAP